jgi:hypothetical protein
MSGGLLCNVRSKLRNCATRSITRYASSTLSNGLANGNGNRHVTFKRRALRLSRPRRPKLISNSEWRNFLASYRAMQRSWRYTSGDHWESMGPALLTMLALRVEHGKSSWRLRWRSFGRLRAAFFLHVAHFGLSAALKVAEVDLAAARNHIQQFKEISQASEEALASLNTTHDEYKSSTETQLAASWVCSVSFAQCIDSRVPTCRPNKKPFRAISRTSSKSSRKPERPSLSRNVRSRVHERNGLRTRRPWKMPSWI